MINQKDIYVGLNLPSNNEPLWIKPLTDGNVALYARVYGEWIAANSHALYYTKTEIDELLAGKANSGYADEHKGMTRNNDTTEFYNFDNLWAAYLGSWGLTLSRGENTGIITYDGKLKVNDEAVVMPSDLASLVDGGDYNSQSKEIELKHGNTVLARIDATAFIKDGMVDNVTISNGNLVITFNTDAGKESISLAITDIFNPANYYDKTAVDTLLSGKVDKELGKSLSTNDYDNNAKALITNILAIPTSKSLTINGMTISFNQDGTVTWDKPVTSVTISPSATQSIHIGDEFSVTATVSPNDARDTSLTWTSSNTSIVSISDHETDVNSKWLYGESLGLATITCTSNADSSKYASIVVNVSEIAVTSVSLNKNSETINKNSTTTLSATVLPSNATNKNVTWSSSNTSVASISPSGSVCTVTGNAVGSATITCTSQADSSKKATCSITVQTPPVQGSYTADVENYDFCTGFWNVAPLSNGDSIRVKGFIEHTTLYQPDYDFDKTFTYNGTLTTVSLGSGIGLIAIDPSQSDYPSTYFGFDIVSNFMVYRDSLEVYVNGSKYAKLVPD